MVRIEPAPRGQSDEVVLTIKLKTLDVRLDDGLVLGVGLDVVDVETGFVVFLSSFCDALVLYFEVLDVLWYLELGFVVAVAVSVGFCGWRAGLDEVLWSFLSLLF